MEGGSEKQVRRRERGIEAEAETRRSQSAYAFARVDAY